MGDACFFQRRLDELCSIPCPSTQLKPVGGYCEELNAISASSCFRKAAEDRRSEHPAASSACCNNGFCEEAATGNVGRESFLIFLIFCSWESLEASRVKYIRLFAASSLDELKEWRKPVHSSVQFEARSQVNGGPCE